MSTATCWPTWLELDDDDDDDDDDVSGKVIRHRCVAASAFVVARFEVSVSGTVHVVIRDGSLGAGCWLLRK